MGRWLAHDLVSAADRLTATVDEVMTGWLQQRSTGTSRASGFQITIDLLGLPDMVVTIGDREFHLIRGTLNWSSQISSFIPIQSGRKKSSLRDILLSQDPGLGNLA